MARFIVPLAACVVACLVSAAPAAQWQPPRRAQELARAHAGTKPHIFLVVADDFGWHNIGWRNPEVRTPHLDAFARAGITLDRHYTFKCNDVVSKSGSDIRMAMIPAKLKTAGYKTAMTGKWHEGARSNANLPINRGFDKHFGFLKGGQDHNTQREGNIIDLWLNDAPAYGRDGHYSTYLYTKYAVEVVENHTVADPLFMYLPFQVTHSPYEVPDRFLNASINNKDRQVFVAMTAALDEGFGNFTAALQRRGMLDNTIIVFTADNGGVYHGNQHGNNWPLRGQKTSDFEGGVRTTAFVWASDNLMAQGLRGSTFSGYVHAADWYSTFCHLAGVDPTDNHPGVPPIDSINQWSSLLTPGANTSLRTEIPLSFCIGHGADDRCVVQGYVPNGTRAMPRNAALVQNEYKLVVGAQFGFGIRVGPVFPNASSSPPNNDPGCPSGCLYDIIADPGERVDLRTTKPQVFAAMMDRLLDLGLTVYQTNYSDVPDSACISGAEGLKRYSGFLGPLCLES